MIRAVIFDLDNTLEDFSEAKHFAKDVIGAQVDKQFGTYGFRLCLSEVSRKRALSALINKDHRLYNRKDMFKECFNAFDKDVKEKDVSKFTGGYCRLLLKSLKLLPHTKETLKILRDNGYKLILVTDADDTREMKIDRVKKLGIYDMFHMIITGNDVKTTKPDKRFFKPIFSRFRIKPSECIAVGDKPEYDLLLPKRLGMTTVWMKYGEWAMTRPKPNYVDYTISDISQILRLMG